MADIETKGISDTSGFKPVFSSEKNPTLSKEEDAPQGQMKYLRDVPQVLQTLEERFPFTAIIISVVGYITIAAFGQMNSLGKYGGYILFLIFTFGIYKNLYWKKVSDTEEKKSFYKIGFWIVSVITLICLIILLFPFAAEIKSGYKKVDAIFQEASSSTPSP